MPFEGKQDLNTVTFYTNLKEGQAAPPANPQFLIVPNAVPSPSVNPGLTPSSTGGAAK